MNYHKQCLLNKNELDGSVIQTTAYLPESFAKVGKWVILQQNDGHWDTGWRIIEVYDRMESDYLMERSSDYKRTRKASDI